MTTEPIAEQGTRGTALVRASWAMSALAVVVAVVYFVLLITVFSDPAGFVIFVAPLMAPLPSMPLGLIALGLGIAAIIRSKGARGHRAAGAAGIVVVIAGVATAPFWPFIFPF